MCPDKKIHFHPVAAQLHMCSTLTVPESSMQLAASSKMHFFEGEFCGAIMQAPRWQKPYQFDPSTTLGNFILENRSLYT